MSVLVIATLMVAPAELPPWVYERARTEAASVIVMDVASVAGLDGADRGQCVVEGRISAVERGDEHTVGQRISIAVPCVGQNWRPRPGPWPGFAEQTFVGTQRGRVWLNGGAMVLRGFDVLQPGED